MKNLTKQKTSKQQGFTLIELVVVIVILGILAVTAAPKFIDIQDDARTATLQGIKAAIQSASTLVHSKSLIAGNEATPASTVKVNGTDVAIIYGYPAADYSSLGGSWSDLLDVDLSASSDNTATTDFKYKVLTTGEYIIYPANNTTPTGIIASTASTGTGGTGDCIVYYTKATATAKYTVKVNPCI